MREMRAKLKLDKDGYPSEKCDECRHCYYCDICNGYHCECEIWGVECKQMDEGEDE